MGYVSVLDTVANDLYNNYLPQGEDAVQRAAREYGDLIKSHWSRLKAEHPNASYDWVKWKEDTIIWPLYSR
jgi:hypothetical protein